MRAAVIFGLASSPKDLKPFQENSDASWFVGLPASASEADAVLVFGGDGTVHRHLAQLARLKLPVLVVPCGSGNDFARALGLRRVHDSLAAWRKFASGGGNVRRIDLGVIVPDPSPSLEEQIPRGLKPARNDKSYGASLDRHYFCCVAGVGLDGEVAGRASRLPRWLRAHGGYALSLPAALMHFAPVPARILTPGNAQANAWVERSAKRTVLAAFANAPTYGGGMKIAPKARLDDGMLDVCVLTDIGKFKLFCLFPTVYFGRHLDLPETAYFQADRLRVETEHPTDVYADGEYVCQTPVRFRVAREALQVVVPE